MMDTDSNENTYEKMISNLDVYSFISKHNTDYDRRLNKLEFLLAVNESLFNLVLEDALNSEDPAKYYDRHSTNSSIEMELNRLFKTEDATLGEKDLALIIERLDLNNDQEVSRKEIHELFIANKNKIVRPFKKKLEESLIKLRFITYHPISFETNKVEYYFSSQDQLKNYYESLGFCEKWGGQLLTLDSETEYQMFRDSPKDYWY